MPAVGSSCGGDATFSTISLDDKKFKEVKIERMFKTVHLLKL